MSINFLPGNFIGETLTEGGKTWTWDGQKWNLSGSSVNGNGDKRYLLAHGDDVTDAPSLADYYWANGVLFSGTTESNWIDSARMLIQPTQVRIDSPSLYGGIDILSEGAASFRSKKSTLNLSGDSVNVSASAYSTYSVGEYLTFSADSGNAKLRSYQSDVILEAGGKEAVERTIDGTSDPKQITNKEYVDAQDELMRQDIIELEEEIDAIAPSVEYGTWKWQNQFNTASPPDPGSFFLLNINQSTVTLTDQYANTTRIVIHNEEYVQDGSPDSANLHTWAKADVGKLIQLYDAADPDFLLGEIIAKDVRSTFVYLDVQLIQTSGQPNDNADPVTGDYLTRVNVFDPPTGGDVSGFVLKTGDTMTGTLQMDGDAAIKTRNLDSGQNSNLEIKHNGVSKVYVGADQTAFQHHIKFAQTGKQVYAGTDMKGLAFYANGVQYVGDYTADKHVATKKNVEEAIYHNPADTSTNKYVDRSGDTMSGDLEIKTPDWGEAALVLNGKRDNTSNASATISFKNQLDTADAYSGYLTYRSTGSAAGFFRFNRNLDLNGQRLTMLASPSSDYDAANKKYVDDTLDFNKYPELS